MDCGCWRKASSPWSPCCDGNVAPAMEYSTPGAAARAMKKGGRSLLFLDTRRCVRLGRRRGLGRLCGAGGVVFRRSLHRQAHAALLIGLDDLDAHRLALLQVIGHRVDALLG